MRNSYNTYWTVRYPDGFLSAFDCLALTAHDARQKAKKKWKRSWPSLKKEGFEAVPVIFKEVRKKS